MNPAIALAPKLARRYNGLMSFRHQFRFLTLAAALLVVSCISVSCISLSAQDTSHRGRKYKPPPPTSKIQVTVLRDSDSKPIENASVIFQLVDEGDKGNMELKTNEDGKSVIDVLPIGSTIRLQIIAKGFQTYGEDYKVDKAEMAFGVRLKRPGEQYSIYKNHDQDGDAQKKDKSTDPDAQKDPAQKDPSKDKPVTPPANPPAQPQQ
jgi:hypothetical protein